MSSNNESVPFFITFPWASSHSIKLTARSVVQLRWAAGVPIGMTDSCPVTLISVCFSTKLDRQFTVIS